MKKNKHISIRIDEDVLQKFHYVSKYEDRSASGQIMYLINNCIREFEEKHGAIELLDKAEK
ncbi:hypothetical protein [Anaerotignum propionicum]|uniref:Arc-like DNA binding domain-containing protein n=1 Tax=Anaerotignum propionicum DSM 1682 TaxID=991789 RepID=A0A0X1U7J1_ANAPI|nr:hypothetical protein [Anaerotignum propionicum]AMJ40909.1 hypothetical protein CPRO_13160 [Anaerotignum propionicum DSM 1682]SHE76161.1 hypothetical protein SAMN02745151_01728 [[Clostridium] propionicum DSM 1682] [Anaerotignum propionicum DSM 1682]